MPPQRFDEQALRVHRRVSGGVETVSLAGELDLGSADVLAAIAGEASDAGLLFDLSNLEFLDPAGIRGLLAAGTRARRTGRGLAIVCPPESAAFRTLRLTRMLGKLLIYRDCDLAREALTGRRPRRDRRRAP